MTDQSPQTPRQTPPKKRRNWMRIVLILSLALNLLIVSALGAAFFKSQKPHGRHMDRASMGLGAYILALPEPAQSEIMSMVGKGSENRRKYRRDMRAYRTELRDALSAEPFSREAVQAAMNGQRDGALNRTVKIQEAYLDAVSNMSDAERAAHFERAQEIAKSRGKKMRKTSKE